MLGGVDFRPVSARLGDIRLARDEQVARKRIVNQRIGNEQDEEMELYLLNEVPRFFGSRGDTILGISRNLLPEEITTCFKDTGLSDDLEIACEEVFFCTHLEKLVDNDFRWAGGFVIGAGEKIGALASRGFLRFPGRSIFVNAFTPEGQFFTGMGFFRAIACQLGYLRNPSSHASRESRDYFAKQYEVDAAKRLAAFLYSSPDDPGLRLAFNTVRVQWLAPAMDQLAELEKQLPN